MKLKSLLILCVAALLALSCATVGRQSAPVVNDSQTLAEQTLVSGIQYYLEDIYDYDSVFVITANETPFFLTEPVPNQTLVSGIQYYLEDVYDYDILFLIQPMIKQTLVSEIQYYLEDIYDYDSVSFVAENETPFFLAESVPKQTFVSGIQYYLEDVYDYDEAFLTTQPVKQTADSKNIADYFAILSIFDENPFSTTEPVPSPTLASGTRYYLEDIYDYDDEQYSGRN